MKIQKRQILLLVCAVVVLVFCGSSLFGAGGRTLEEREEQLSDAANGEAIEILGEITNQGYIISSIRGADGREGLAIFQPARRDRYTFMAWAWYDAGEAAWMRVPIDKVSYDYFWQNGENLSYVELTYTIDGTEQEPICLECGAVPIICIQTPDGAQDVCAVFYDEAGNVCE